VGTLTESWERVGSTIVAPAGAVSAEMTLWLVHASGWVAFDEVQVSPAGTSTNLVTNPGFEAATGWTVERLNPGTSFWRGGWGTGVPSAGTYAYTISNHVYAKLQSDPVTVDPSTEYDLTTWVRGELDDDDRLLGIKVRVAYYRADDSLIRAQDIYNDWGVALSETWAQVGGRFTTPTVNEQCDHLRVELWNFQSSGWVAFDDVELTRAPPTVQFTQAEYTVGEADDQVGLTVTLSHAPEDAVNVSYATQDGTAIAGQDYTATSGVLTWSPGDATPRMIAIPILDDELVEGDEAFDVQLTSPTGAQLGSVWESNVRVQDDDLPVVAMATGSVGVEEGSVGDVDIFVSLVEAPTRTVSVVVGVRVGEGSATPGADYDPVLETVTWQPGDPLHKSVSLHILDDSDLEPGEDLFVDLGSPAGLTLADRASTTVTIQDDEATALEGWRIEAHWRGCGGTDGEWEGVSFKQVFDEPPVVVTTTWPTRASYIRVRNVTRTGFECVRIAPEGYADTNWAGFLAVERGSHVFDDGTRVEAGIVSTTEYQHGAGVPDSGGTGWASPAVTFPVPFPSDRPPVLFTQVQTANNWTLAPGGEDVPVWLTPAVRNLSENGVELSLERGAMAAGDVGNAEGIGYIAFSTIERIPSRGDGTGYYLPYAIPLDPSMPGSFQIRVWEIDSFFNDTPGECQSPVYFNREGVLPFISLSSRANDDGFGIMNCNYDADLVGGILSVASVGSKSLTTFLPETQSNASFDGLFETIVPVPTVKIESFEPTTLPEGNPGDPPNAFTLTLSLSKQWAEPVSVALAVSNPPGTTPATPGDDFTLPEITIPAFTEGLVDFTIGIVPDALFEGDEAFTLTIESATNATIDDTSGLVTATIVDDEPAPVATISAGQAYEGDEATIAVTGTLSVAVQGGASVTLTPVEIVGDPEAVADEDFFDTPPITLTWADGATASTTAFVTLVNDNVSEFSERFTFILDSASPAAVAVPLNGVYATITDDDPQPVVAFVTLTPPPIVEGSSALGGTVTLDVSLTNDHAGQITVGIAPDADDPGTAQASDFSLAPASLTWEGRDIGPKQVTVTITGDEIVESESTVHLALSLISGLAVVSDDNATITIEDDDVAGIEITPSQRPLETDEGGASVDVGFRLTAEPTSEVKIRCLSSNADEGRVQAPSDLTFTTDNWDVEKSITVTGQDDAIPDHDTPYSVDVTIETTAPGYEHLVVEPIAFINLDDEAQPEVKFTQSTVMVLEGAQLDVEVRVNPMPVEAFSVHWQIVDGTGLDGAHAGSDYQPSDGGALSGDLSYADGVWTGQIPAIDILPDGTVDLDQEFTITLSSPTAAVSLGEPSTLTVTIHDPAVPAAIIGEPTGRFYGYQNETLMMDGTSSVVPEGFEKKFVVLRNRWGDLEDPLWLENDTNGLLFDTFQTDHDMQYYLVRLVIATPDAMPTLDQMKHVAQPCVDTSPFECSEADVQVLPTPEGAIHPFLTGYVMPQAVLLKWQPLLTSLELERSDDGGDTWIAIDGAWDFNGDGHAGRAYIDRTLTQGHSYHYRIRDAQEPPLDPLPWVYLGNSLLSPGDAVTTPDWTAPRPVPTFESVEWACPDEASRFLCPGTVTIRLDPEPGESLVDSTINVFVNEGTFEATDIFNDPVEVVVPDEFPFKGRDEPACVTKGPRRNKFC
jgi:hypothetical protein